MINAPRNNNNVDAVASSLASSPRHHTQLQQLHTVAAMHAHTEQLKGELSKALLIAQQLHQHNTVLQSAWTTLKSECDDVKSNYALVREQADIAIAAKTAAESECEQLYGVWQSKLEQKQLEYESIQAAMVPTREIELIRIQILNDCQQQHAAHMDELKSDIDHHRSLYHAAHHSLSLMTSESSLRSASFDKDIAQHSMRSDRIIGELSAKNRKLQQLVQDTTLEDRCKSTDRSHMELLVKSKALMSENVELAAAATAARTELELARLALASLEADTGAQGAVDKRERELLLKKLADATTELAVSHAQVHSLRDERIAASKVSEFRSNQYELNLADQGFKLDAATKRMNAMERADEVNQSQYRDAIDEAGERQTTLERKLVDAAQRAEYDARDHAAATKSLKEEHACTVRELEHSALLLNEAKQHLQQSLLELELAKNVDIAALQHRTLILQSDIAVLHTERDAFDQRLSESKSTIDAQRIDIDAKSKDASELQSEYDNLQHKYRLIADKEHSASMMLEKTLLEHDSMRNELNSANASLEDERRRFMKDNGILKTQLRNDKTILLQRLEDVHHASQSNDERHEKLLSEAKREKNKYKKLSLGLKQKMNEILREYAQSQRDHSLALESSRFALSNAQTGKDDAERQRDEYKQRLGAAWPQTMIMNAAATSSGTFAHTHMQHHDAPVAGTNHGQIASATQIDVSAGVRAAQQQLASMRSRSSTASAS